MSQLSVTSAQLDSDEQIPGRVGLVYVAAYTVSRFHNIDSADLMQIKCLNELGKCGDMQEPNLSSEARRLTARVHYKGHHCKRSLKSYLVFFTASWKLRQNSS